MRGPRWAAAALIGLALIHGVPLAGIFGQSALQAAYGVGPLPATELLLLQHRAVLFGLLAAGLLWSLRRPALRGPALVATAVSDGSFLLLAAASSPLPAALLTLVQADSAALLLVAVAAWGSGKRPAVRSP